MLAIHTPCDRFVDVILVHGLADDGMDRCRQVRGRKLDPQEKLIVRALVRNPRYLDNRISAVTGVPVRTVRRKRARLEQEGVLSYSTVVERQSIQRHGPVHRAASADR